MPRLSIILLAWILLLVLSSQEVLAEFRAGAAVVDISPQSFPVFIGGRGNRESSWEGRIDEVVVHRLQPSRDLTSK